MPYTLLEAGSQPIGGLLAPRLDMQQGGARPSWCGHGGMVSVVNPAEKLKAAGGRMPELPAAAWLYCFNVEAIDAAFGRVKAGGGQVVHGTMDVPGGRWIINAIDPQCAMFALASSKR